MLIICVTDNCISYQKNHKTINSLFLLPNSHYKKQHAGTDIYYQEI